ncbi:MAG: alanine racemase [Actinomycetota bacterium]|nr:alanine racemase [Actinomycetota bacterium]MDH4354101.1 alanine racemase [Actinomycetota bacterium]MDH5278108.1 alanine racemase [Actinomycetota bacterium]
MSQHLREAVIDLDAVRDNTAVLVERSGAAGLMAVVKADAYGHGLVPCARAVLDGGASWLGVALVEEALALRAAGITAPVLAWLVGPDEQWSRAVAADVDLSVSASWAVDAVRAAAGALGRPARVHLKVDTGLGRGGSVPTDWPELVAHARRGEQEGRLDVVGVWSHFAYADAPGHPTIDRQLATFHEALAVAAAAGLRPRVRHLANSAAVVTRPDSHFDLTRPGLGLYGLSPIPGEQSAAQLGLRPAMSLTARFALVKRVPAGHGVSYGHTYTTDRETTLGLLPIGYADGVDRRAGNVGPLWAAGRRRTVAGRVCMDQLVVDLGDDAVDVGDRAVLFGDGERGEPTAQDWATALDTISYEVVSRIGPRVVRRFVGGTR